MSDLTQRIWHKVRDAIGGVVVVDGGKIVALDLSAVNDWLPLLLTEPEALSGLPEQVRLSVLTREQMTHFVRGQSAAIRETPAMTALRRLDLTPLERAELRVGRAVIAEAAAWKAWNKKAGDRAIAACEAAERERVSALAEASALIAEANALTSEAKDG